MSEVTKEWIKIMLLARERRNNMVSRLTDELMGKPGETVNCRCHGVSKIRFAPPRDGKPTRSDGSQ